MAKFRGPGKAGGLEIKSARRRDAGEEHWGIVSSCLNIPISKEKYTKEASGHSHGKSKNYTSSVVL